MGRRNRRLDAAGISDDERKGDVMKLKITTDNPYYEEVVDMDDLQDFDQHADFKTQLMLVAEYVGLNWELLDDE